MAPMGSIPVSYVCFNAVDVHEHVGTFYVHIHVSIRGQLIILKRLYYSGWRVCSLVCGLDIKESCTYFRRIPDTVFRIYHIYFIILEVKPEFFYQLMRDLFETGFPLTMLVTRQILNRLCFK